MRRTRSGASAATEDGTIAAFVPKAGTGAPPVVKKAALKTTEAVDGELLPVGGAYAFRPRVLHNLLADKFIADHSAVKGKEVAYAVLSAIGST